MTERRRCRFCDGPLPPMRDGRAARRVQCGAPACHKALLAENQRRHYPVPPPGICRYCQGPLPARRPGQRGRAPSQCDAPACQDRVISSLRNKRLGPRPPGICRYCPRPIPRPASPGRLFGRPQVQCGTPECKEERAITKRQAQEARQGVILCRYCKEPFQRTSGPRRVQCGRLECQKKQRDRYRSEGRLNAPPEVTRLRALIARWGRAFSGTDEAEMTAAYEAMMREADAIGGA